MNFTENALSQFKQLIENNGTPGSGIRFSTAQGCCSPSLQMDIAPSPEQSDVVTKTGEVNFYVTPEADKILSAITIDFSDGSFRTKR